jgi:hypothetical protein
VARRDDSPFLFRDVVEDDDDFLPFDDADRNLAYFLIVISIILLFDCESLEDADRALECQPMLAQVVGILLLVPNVAYRRCIYNMYLQGGFRLRPT